MLSCFFQIGFLAFALAARSRTVPTEIELPTNNAALQVLLGKIQVAEPKRFVLSFAFKEETASLIELKADGLFNHGKIRSVKQLYEIVGKDVQ